MKALPPASTIGIVGGGQLGRMLVMAAATMGYKTHVYHACGDTPATQISNFKTHAPYDDHEAMRIFAESVDVVTFEFENIPYESLKTMAEHAAVHPKPEILRTTRHRMREKAFINDCGIATAPHASVTSLESLERAIVSIGVPSILKTCELGYDGKGQIKLDSADNLSDVWQVMDTQEAVLEGFVPFERELSVIVARNLAGEMRCYPLAHNIHKNHILHQTIVPAGAHTATEAQATHIAQTLAEKLDLVGIMAVELFALQDGSLIVNELAPRPHNSGHWSMNGCSTSQFEQHIRAITGHALGDTRLTSPTEMVNLIGDDVLNLAAYHSNPNAHLHVYGKKEVREGRKMGHVNILKP